MCHIIVVGTYMDNISSNPQQLKKECEHVDKFAKGVVERKQFAGFVPLDHNQRSCLLDVLRKSCKALASSQIDKEILLSLVARPSHRQGIFT